MRTVIACVLMAGALGPAGAVYIPVTGSAQPCTPKIEPQIFGPLSSATCIDYKKTVTVTTSTTCPEITPVPLGHGPVVQCGTRKRTCAATTTTLTCCQ
ncbi:hypothetical protein K470DRAFT_255737 [Piedraia hortae CBS 480.64]|uniref:Uncharacterized protein n=1 Tax=Piedraia hortae CBS 480.64 TaxID=1314780 RepID=A0A6A7C636_9PEZI|nr:hypothetical protein K470DRAFT_255737 [Piedraia hortae CBS 480.64]